MGRMSNDRALHDVFVQYYRQLCFHARRYVASNEDARDVVMDTFLRLHSREVRFDDPLALRSFLYTAVYNAAINKRRNDARRNSRDDSFARQAHDVNYQEDIILSRIEDETMYRLLSAIEELPEQCSRVFKLSYMEGRNIAETAAALGISENTVRVHRARAKRLLQEKLRDLYPLLVWLWL